MAKPPKSVITKKLPLLIDFAEYCITRAGIKGCWQICSEGSKRNQLAKEGVQKHTRLGDKKFPTCKLASSQRGFMGFQERNRQAPKVGAIYNSVAENIPMIIKIQSQYLSAMNDMETAQGLIDEGRSKMVKQ